MRIAVLSDCRMPTLPFGGHGLGRVAYDLAGQLKQRGHTVYLFAGAGSKPPVGVEFMAYADETAQAEAMLRGNQGVWQAVVDLSHSHVLSKIDTSKPVVNYMMDDECDYHPVNALVCNGWQLERFQMARIAPLGVDVKAIPFAQGGDNLLFCAKLCAEKGVDIALDVAARSGMAMDVYGRQPPSGTNVIGGKGEITDQAELYRVLGGAYALLAPSRYDAGGRVVLEAAAAGTPTITLDWSGTACHVEDSVSGFVCATADEMVEAVKLVPMLQRRAAREWVRETHSLAIMTSAVEDALTAALDGETW